MKNKIEIGSKILINGKVYTLKYYNFCLVWERTLSELSHIWHAIAYDRDSDLTDKIIKKSLNYDYWTSKGVEFTHLDGSPLFADEIDTLQLVKDLRKALPDVRSRKTEGLKQLSDPWVEENK